MKMQRENSSVWHKVTTFSHAPFIMPEDDKEELFLFSVSSLATADIAAVFALFFGIQIDKRFKELNDTLSPYYTHYALDEVSRGDLDSATTAHLYDLFNQIQESRSVSDIIKELEPIYNSFDDDYTYNAYTNDIAWNLALAYVKDDQIDKAITILQKLKADNPDTPIYIKADALIKKLQDL